MLVPASNQNHAQCQVQSIRAAKRSRKNKNPPPEGVVLSLPLKGDKNASCPLRGRGVVPGSVIL